MLTKTLPWFTFAGVIDDLGQYLQKHIPVGYRDVIVFARSVTIQSDISLNSTYYLEPIELTIICQELAVERKRLDVAGIAYIFDNFVIDLSGNSAPDMLSFHETMEAEAWHGKAGCQGGSLSIFCQNKVGEGKLNVNLSGGNGGKGQDGYLGQPGKKGHSGINGENGGIGGRGGDGGNPGVLQIICSKSRPESIINQCYSNGGNAGLGGTKGKGGVGDPSGKDGKDGSDGPNGDMGEALPPILKQVDEVAFYQSLPITANYLQRALNAETVQLLRIKHKAVPAELFEAEQNLMWIMQISEQSAYNVLVNHCTNVLDICRQRTEPYERAIGIETAMFNDMFGQLGEIAQKTAGIHPQQLPTNIPLDPLLSARSKTAQVFNHLHSFFEQNLSRYNSAKEVAGVISNPPAVDPRLERALATPSSTYIMQQVMQSAEQEPLIVKLGNRTGRSTAATASGDSFGSFGKRSRAATAPGDSFGNFGKRTLTEHTTPEGTSSDSFGDTSGRNILDDFLDDTSENTSYGELDSTWSGSTALEFGDLESSIDSSEFLSLEGGSLIGEGIGEGILEGVGEGVAIEGAEVVAGGVLAAMIPADIAFPPLVVVEAVVGAVVFAAIGIISALFELHSEAIARYEAAVRARVQLEKQNRLRLRHDEKEQDPPEKRKRRKKERSESGIFVGVLDKCEPVEGEGGFVVATFDCIPLEFTTNSDKKEVDVNLDNLDSTQEEELAIQLLRQRSPYTSSPAFFITATLPEMVVTEKSSGHWFQFDADFKDGGMSEAVEITPLISFGLGKLLRLATSVTTGSIPVTVNKVKALSVQTENKVAVALSSKAESSIGDLVPRMKQQARLAEQGKASVTKTTGGKSSQAKKPAGKRPQQSGKSVNTKDQKGKVDGRRAMPKKTTTVSRVFVANVGQGSCIFLLDEKNNIKLAFDFGYGGIPNPTVLAEIARSPILVLSHWDLDHYRFLANSPHIALGKTLIVPLYGENVGPGVTRVSQSARESAFAYHAFGAGNVLANQQIIPPNVTLPSNVTLSMTTIVPEFVWNKNSLGAITACVHNQQTNQKLLMPGDASYSHVAPNQKVGLSHLIATHHGSTNSIVRDRGAAGSIPRPVIQNGTLCFSYGLNNPYRHSVNLARAFYQPKGWTATMTTVDHPQGITITL